MSTAESATMAIVVATLLTSIIGVAVGLYYGRRAARASERAAVAAEQENKLLVDQLNEATEANRPSVSLVVRETWQYTTRAEGVVIGIKAELENNSRADETVQQWKLRFQGSEYLAPVRRGERPLETEPEQKPPFALRRGYPQEIRLLFQSGIKEIPSDSALPAQLIVECLNAGGVEEHFTV